MSLLGVFRLLARLPRGSSVLLIVTAALPLIAYGAKPVWQPIPPEVLTETAPRMDANAPAEILLLKIDVDDRRFPHERTTTTHLRYKIYDPQKAEEITRVSGIEFEGSDDRMEIHARLVSPDGRVQEFGKEAIRERPLLQQARQSGVLGWLAGSGRPAAKERFLAVAGVERGAVLEYHFRQVDRYPSLISSSFGQREKFPVRQLDYRARLVSDDNFRHRAFVTNARTVDLKEDPKARTITVVGENLPAVTLEPFSGPLTSNILTIFSCYEQSTLYLLPRSGRVKLPDKLDGAAGPWAPYATLMDWFSRDRSYASKRIEALAAEITAGAADHAAKAEAIHTWVVREAQACRREAPHPTRRRAPQSLDDVLDWGKDKELVIDNDEFLWLALALYRSARLTAHLVLLPDRFLSGFDVEAVSPVFLQHRAIALRIGEEWRFSAPHLAVGLPFGLLPWQNAGQQGLLALEKQQQFIPVATAEPQRSLLGTAGTLALHADGLLEGELVRRLTGHLAVPVRGALLDAPPAERAKVARANLHLDIPGMDVTVRRIDGLDDPEKPIDIVCHVRWPAFAVRTKDRLVLRPLVFRAEGKSPFPATDRKRPVHFPFRWQELDQVSITVPAEYEIESPSRPADVPSSALYYKVDFTWDASTHKLGARRQFMSNIAALPVEKYTSLREFYEHVVASDQHEIVLRKRTDTAAVK
jgi:hypothetical protein